MSKDYEEPPSISQLIGINGKLAKRIKQLQAELATAKEENQRLLAVARLALVLDDVESIKNVLQPWKGE